MVRTATAKSWLLHLTVVIAMANKSAHPMEVGVIAITGTATEYEQPYTQPLKTLV